MTEYTPLDLEPDPTLGGRNFFPKERADALKRPSHHTFSTIEVIDAIEAWGLDYHLGNVVKYIARADRKGKALEDLRKAAWYLNREVLKREAGECTET